MLPPNPIRPLSVSYVHQGQQQGIGKQQWVPTPLPCGWTKDHGLKTFNQLAKEVYKNRKQHGEEFDKAFKISCEKEKMSSTNTTPKRKRNYFDTYNDLNEGEPIIKEEELSGSDGEKWAARNVFMV